MKERISTDKIVMKIADARTFMLFQYNHSQYILTTLTLAT